MDEQKPFWTCATAALGFTAGNIVACLAGMISAAAASERSFFQLIAVGTLAFLLRHYRKDPAK